MNEPAIYFNGIDATTGDYLVPPLTESDAARIARGDRLDTDHLSDLDRKQHAPDATLRVAEGVDPRNLRDTGWGVVFAAGDPRADELREALGPLLTRRKSQADKRYRIYFGPDGYGPRESKSSFLSRHGSAPGMPAENVPYYLLIVAPPEKGPLHPEGVISYRAEYQLGVERAVGRVHFDTIEEYARYAESVVEIESAPPARSRCVQFFSPTNKGDRATELSTSELAVPLAGEIGTLFPQWRIEQVSGEAATRPALERVLCAADTALLFTASHGVGVPKGSPDQRRTQGALLCSEWTRGENPLGPVPPEYYFGGETLASLGSRARVRGLVTFHFACFGAGTPWLDEYSRAAGKTESLADEAFVGWLPQKLLTHPGGGALAVVGHVERARGYSFLWPGAPTQRGAMRDTLRRLLDGYPVGYALEYLRDRYAALSVEINEMQKNFDIDGTIDSRQLTGLWTAQADGKSYVIVGDPAVRLSV